MTKAQIELTASREAIASMPDGPKKDAELARVGELEARAQALDGKADQARAEADAHAAEIAASKRVRELSDMKPCDRVKALRQMDPAERARVLMHMSSEDSPRLIQLPSCLLWLHVMCYHMSAMGAMLS